MRNSILTLVLVCASALPAAPMDQKDVEYAHAGGKPQLLDLHVPDGPGPFPAAILVHGGGFDEGSKSTNVRPLFDVLTNAGIAWFSIDYRMAPAFRFPEASRNERSLWALTASHWGVHRGIAKQRMRSYRQSPLTATINLRLPARLLRWNALLVTTQEPNVYFA